MKASTLLIIGVVVLVIGAGIFLFYEIFSSGNEELPLEQPFEFIPVPSGPETMTSLTSTAPSEFTPVGDLVVSPQLSGPEITPTGPITSSPFTFDRTEPSTLGGQTYEVKKGDSLWSIAKKFYNDGSPSKIQLIREANPDKLTKGDLIKPGMVLTIPSVEGAQTPVNISRPEPPELTPVGTGKDTLTTSADSSINIGTYTVRKGDTLEKIAKKVYRDSKKYKLILEANRDKLKTRDTTLKIGWKLLIPDDSQKME